MRFSAVVKIGLLSLIVHSTTQAELSTLDAPLAPLTIHYGTAGRSVGPDDWYEISTLAYPETTPLSLGRNVGEASGEVYLSPTGFTIGEAGDYSVTISAILQNPNEDSNVLIPVFLALDDVYDPEAPGPIGGIVTLVSEQIDTVHGTGIIRNVVPGTRLSLVATNAGYPFPVAITVVSWGISLHKIN